MKKIIYSFILITGFLFTNYVEADVLESTGLVSGSVWFSKDDFKEGDSIKVYTAFWNGEKSKIFAKVEFYDKSVVLGNRDIDIVPEEIKEVSIPLKITSGDHSIYAKVVSSQILNEKGVKEKIVLSNNKTKENILSVSKVIVDKEDGEIKTSGELIKDEISKANESFTNILPESVRTPLSNTFKKVEDFRGEELEKVKDNKEKIKEEIKILENKENVSSTDKPIAELKNIFLSVLEMVLSNKFLFYGISIFVIFLVVRFIFKKL